MEYKNVPNMLSTKDVMYLEDMFKWNYGAFKSVSNITTKDANINTDITKMVKFDSDDVQWIEFDHHEMIINDDLECYAIKIRDKCMPYYETI